jgi:hypothetical protein
VTQDLFELEAPQDALDTTEAGPAHMQPPAPVSQLTKHWDVARKEWIDTIHLSHATEALLALGAIRSVYWLAVGSAELALAKEIAEWWADCEPLHGLGEIIK